MKDETTWSPAASVLTPSPTSTTSPAASWPSTSGGFIGMVPLVAERSEWQTPQAPSLTVTSPRRGPSSSISPTTTGLFNSRHRTAFALRDIDPVYAGKCAGKMRTSPEIRMLARDKLFIGGRWVAPSGSETIEVHDAGTGAVMGRIPAGGPKDVDAAVDAARTAFPAWSSLAAQARGEFLEKISAG